MVKILLDYGAKATNKDNNGDTALHVLCRDGNSNPILRELLGGFKNETFRLFEVNNSGQTPLDIANINMKPFVINNISNKMIIFAENNDLKNVKLYVRYGADINATRGFPSKTAYEVTTNEHIKEFLKRQTVLQQEGSKLMSKDEYDKMISDHQAKQKENLDLMKRIDEYHTITAKAAQDLGEKTQENISLKKEVSILNIIVSKMEIKITSFESKVSRCKQLKILNKAQQTTIDELINENNNLKDDLARLRKVYDEHVLENQRQLNIQGVLRNQMGVLNNQILVLERRLHNCEIGLQPNHQIGGSYYKHKYMKYLEMLKKKKN